MGAYLLRRLLLIVPTLIGIMLVNFTLTQFVPGGPIEQIVARVQAILRRTMHASVALDKGIDLLLGVNPFVPALAATFAASFGFMLPVSTPPNGWWARLLPESGDIGSRSLRTEKR